MGWHTSLYSSRSGQSPTYLPTIRDRKLIWQWSNPPTPEIPAFTTPPLVVCHSPRRPGRVDRVLENINHGRKILWYCVLRKCCNTRFDCWFWASVSWLSHFWVEVHRHLLCIDDRDEAQGWNTCKIFNFCGLSHNSRVFLTDARSQNLT